MKQSLVIDSVTAPIFLELYDNLSTNFKIQKVALGERIKF